MPPLYRMLEVCVYSLTNFLPFLAMALYPFRRRLRFSPAVAAALVAVLTLLFVGGADYSPLALLAIALVCTGAIGLGVVDATEDPELRAARQAEGNRKYSKSFLALTHPVAYCLLDAAGTFADNRVLEILTDRYMNAGMFATLRECADQAAASANCAY